MMDDKEAEVPPVDKPAKNAEKTTEEHATPRPPARSAVDELLAEDVAKPAAAARPTSRSGRGRAARQVPVGVAHILATFNNTQVTISDPRGAVIAWSTAGRAGFKGSRKSTAFAATVVGQEAARQAVGRGMHEVEVHVQGPGAGRESAIRALQSTGLSVTAIKDVTPVPHNGCRQRKRRRV